MALLFMDGFDTGDLTKWAGSSAFTLDAATRFSVGKCVRTNSLNIVSKIVPASAKLIVGFAFNPNGLGSWDTILSFAGYRVGAPHSDMILYGYIDYTRGV